MKSKLFFIAFFTIVVTLFAAGGCQQHNTVFWIAVRNASNKPTQSFWDYQTIRFMAEHGDFVVIGGRPEGTEPPLYDWVRRAYDWGRVIRLFHRLNPKLPVLLYGRATQWISYEAGIAGLILGKCSDDSGVDEIKRYMLSLPALPAIPGSEPDSDDRCDSYPISALEPGCEDDKSAPKMCPDGPAWGHLLDIRNPEFHSYLGDRLEWFYNETGADGVAFDGHVPHPLYSPRSLRIYCNRANDLQSASVSSAAIDEAIDFCEEYANGMRLLHRSLKRRFPRKRIVFNGGLAYERELELFHNPSLLDEDRCSESFSGSYSQRKTEEARRLLDNSDGAAIEFFGNHPEIFKFGLVVEPYLEILQNHSDKHILVFGRSKDKSEYQDYVDDYLWQRYLYGSYLLAKTPKSLFKYHTTFLNVSILRGGRIARSGGMDVYADWQLDFGKPLGPYREEGGLLIREFTKSLVLVNPHDPHDLHDPHDPDCDPREQITYRLPRPMFSSEKERKDEVVVEPGQAKFFFYRAPDVPEVMIIDFENFLNPGIAGWTPAGRWTEIGSERVAERDNKFLRINAIPASAFSEFSECTEEPEPCEEPEPWLYWEHDILLDAVRPHPDFIRPDLTMRVRSDDPDLKLFLIAEVDDNLSSGNYLVIEVSPGESVEIPCPGDGTFKCIRTMPYRARDSRFDPYLHYTTLWPDSSEWHTFQLKGDEIIDETGRFSFRRWAHMRVVGSADIDDIMIR